jgi:hypothetical protein
MTPPEDPAAMQKLTEAHETADSSLPSDPVGVGVFSIVHIVPSQASVRATCPPSVSTKLPTPMQEVAEAHDTPDSSLSCAPVGSGVVSIAQLVPFQASASVTPVAELPL